jgi:predicted metal-dependent peptidase
VRSFDTAVRDVDDAALSRGQLAGGGGTDFDAPVRDLVDDRELAAGVLFTDGQAEVSTGAGAALVGSGTRLYTVYILRPGENPPPSSLAQYCTESISVSVDPGA